MLKSGNLLPDNFQITLPAGRQEFSINVSISNAPNIYQDQGIVIKTLEH